MHKNGGFPKEDDRISKWSIVQKLHIKFLLDLMQSDQKDEQPGR